MGLLQRFLMAASHRGRMTPSNLNWTILWPTVLVQSLRLFFLIRFYPGLAGCIEWNLSDAPGGFQGPDLSPILPPIWLVLILGLEMSFSQATGWTMDPSCQSLDHHEPCGCHQLVLGTDTASGVSARLPPCHFAQPTEMGSPWTLSSA